MCSWKPTVSNIDWHIPNGLWFDDFSGNYGPLINNVLYKGGTRGGFGILSMWLYFLRIFHGDGKV